MEKTKRFDEISIMRVLAMTMIVAFHSMCFYNGKWLKVNAIMIPLWTKVSAFLDVIDLNMFVFISGYLYGYLYIFRNKYRHPSEVIRNKAIRLLLPYCFWGSIMAAVWPWNTWGRLLYGIGHLWFLLMLFGVFTLTVLLQLLNNQRIRFTGRLGILLIVLGYLANYIFLYVYLSWRHLLHQQGDVLFPRFYDRLRLCQGACRMDVAQLGLYHTALCDGFPLRLYMV